MDKIPLPPVGMILLAHVPPKSPFAQKVVVIVRSQSSGIMGLCINQPLRLTVSDFEESFDQTLDTIPVYCGGPCQPGKLTITGLEYVSPHHMQWHFDLNPHALSQCAKQHPHMELKAFCGYVGWDFSQFTAEIEQKQWLPIPVTFPSIFLGTNTRLWEALMLQFYPFALETPYLPKNPHWN